MAIGLTSLIFVVRAHTPLHERVDRLLDFYLPLGVHDVRIIRLPRLSLVVGEMCFGPPSRAPHQSRPQGAWEDARDAFLLWGGPLPARLSGERLLRADDDELRGLDRTFATFAANGGRARLVTGCSGATALFSARSAQAEVWSSHAVAASYLANGRADIDLTTLPEFFAAEFVGAGRTHITGVSEVPAATDIAFTDQTVARRSYWPMEDRFARLPEAAARASADAALLGSLESRLSSAGDIELGLTAGADSRVTAIALNDLGLEFKAFTIAPSRDAPDVRGAAAVAQALGVQHSLYGYELLPDSDAAALIQTEARWAEGLAPLNGLGWAESGTPAVVVTGGGGETGRAWYYRWQARNYRNPSRAQLRRVLRHLHWRIEPATADAHQQLESAMASWIEAAQTTGHTGWRTLDVVYENERLRRWGRARLARGSAPSVYAFSSPILTRALISLPLEDRISDGFHRQFVATRERALALDRPPAQRRGVPTMLRRLKAAARHKRGLDPASRSAWFLNEMWADRPLNRALIADGALSRDLLRSTMGAEWVERVRAGFLAGEAYATEMAFLATGIAALDAALESLR